MKRAIKGNDKAFLLLMSQCKEQIYRTAFVYVKQEELALDIVQEVVCKAYKNIEKLKEPKFFNTWIMRITINVSTEFYNTQKKVVYMEQSELLNKADKSYEENNDSMFVLEALEKLDDKYKKIIISFMMIIQK